MLCGLNASVLLERDSSDGCMFAALIALSAHACGKWQRHGQTDGTHGVPSTAETGFTYSANRISDAENG